MPAEDQENAENKPNQQMVYLRNRAKKRTLVAHPLSNLYPNAEYGQPICVRRTKPRTGLLQGLKDPPIA